MTMEARKLMVLVSAGLCFAVAGEVVRRPPAKDCPLFPVPKAWHDSEESWHIDPGAAAIAIPASASDQETYAADRLRMHIRNRFKIELPVVLGDGLPETVKTVLRLETTAVREGKLNGFTIRFMQNDRRYEAIVRGQDANGTIYGGDVLFDLMSREPDGGIRIDCIDIDDWPSIPFRGRPHFVLMQNLVPGVLDAYVRARMNFTDVRDNPGFRVTPYYPDRAAPMGFLPGCPLDRLNIACMIEASHRRGFFVYACVAAATTERAGGTTAGFDKLQKAGFYDDVNRTFEELIELGCDGLWLSFDDIGKGADPEKAISSFLELGRKHNMTGRKLAFTPPLGDYSKIDTPFNRETAGIDGFDAIQWFFTRVPCRRDADMAGEIGLRLPPGWWHNLIGLRGGFTNNAKIAVTLREGALELPGAGKVGFPLVDKTDGKPVGVSSSSGAAHEEYTWETYPCEIPRPAYLELQPMAAGWGAPTYDRLRDAAKYADNVMLWCVGGGWPEEYLAVMIGLWAWAPETHDWDRLRTAVYSYVYGPDMAAVAREFDDGIVDLKSRYHLPVRICGPNKGWPCRLKDVSQRDDVLAGISRLESLAATLTANAPEGSAIDPKRLEYIYLEPMRATVQYARRMALCDYPEQSIPTVEEKVDECLDSGKIEEAEELWADAKARGLAQLQQIERELSGLKLISDYGAFWRDRLGLMDRVFSRMRMSPEERNEAFLRIITAPASDTFPLRTTSFEALFKCAETPPPLSVSERLCREMSHEIWDVAKARCTGAFAAGTLAQPNPGKNAADPLVGIGFPRRTPGQAGEYGRVRCSFEIPNAFSRQQNLRLQAQLFLTDTRLDGKWSGYRFAQLWVSGKQCWSTDVVLDQSGKEWISLDLSEAARQALSNGRTTLSIALRVVDERAVSSFPTIVFVGPVRLILAEP